jgi:hypothetical protein
MDHPNTIDGMRFKSALPFAGAFMAAPRRRRVPVPR